MPDGKVKVSAAATNLVEGELHALVSGIGTATAADFSLVGGHGWLFAASGTLYFIPGEAPAEFPEDWHDRKPVSDGTVDKFRQWKERFGVSEFPCANEAAFLLGIDPSELGSGELLSPVSVTIVEGEVRTVEIKTNRKLSNANGRVVVKASATPAAAEKDWSAVPATIGDDGSTIVGLDAAGTAKFYRVCIVYGE